MTRAAVLYSCPGDLTIEDIEIDKPGPHEVLIQTVAAGLCHSDLHFMEGKYTIEVPAVLGHESAGVVTAVGPEVSYVRPGDHVITCVSAFCGECEDCLRGHPALCRNPVAHVRPDGAPPRLRLDDTVVTQFAGLGSYSSDLLVHERALVKIDDEMPLDRAALIGCGVTTGLGAVFNTAKVSPGSTVAVFGCGGIGLNVVQGARLAGAARIIAVDRVDAKLELARQLGATDGVNAAQADPVAEIIGMTGGGVHFSFEAIGLKVAAEQAFNVLRPGGAATVIGMIPVGQMVEIPGAALLTEKKLQGSIMGSNRFRIDMPFYIQLYRQGRLKLDELVSARIGLEDINAGYAEMKKGEIARSVIMFCGSAGTSNRLFGGPFVLKRFAYLKKRADLSTESFINYYENQHVPLILSLAPPPLVYKRHYLIRGDEFNSGEDDLDFDVVAEFGWADHAAQLAWAAAIQAAADRVAADEINFLDRAVTRFVLIEERVTAG